MAENFLDQAPVGTKVFNKGNKRYYVKKQLGDRTIWKESLGSSLTVGDRSLTKDDYNRKGEKNPDYIPDYLQKDFWTGRELIQIKNGKYYNPIDKELTGLKIGDRRMEVYTIEDFNSKTGVDLQNRLTEGIDYRKYLDKNKKANNLKKKIEYHELLTSKGKINLAKQIYSGDINDLKKQLKVLGPIEPFKGESNSTPINKYTPTRKGVEFDLQASNNANKDLQIGIG